VVRFENNDHVDDDLIEEKIATRASSKFLGIFRGVVFDYSLFDYGTLQADLERIERLYRAQGYYQARVRASHVQYIDRKHVEVTIIVEEGPPIRVRHVRIAGSGSLETETRDAMIKAADQHLSAGDRFEEGEFESASNAVLLAMTDRGYAYAKIKKKAQVDLVHRTVDVRFDVEPDVHATWGKTTIEGLGDLPEGPVRRALDIKPGAEYSTAEMREAQQAVLNLGVFSSVEIEPDLVDPRPSPRVIPVKVKVTPTKLRTLRLGGGLELDVIRTDVHLMAGWQDRNFLGGMREFDIEFRPGVVLYPTRIQQWEMPTDFLLEEKLRTRFRQPGFIEARTNGLIRGQFDTYPVLLSNRANSTGTVLGYHELRGATGVERNFGPFYVMPMYNLQANFPFAYIGDSRVPTALVSYVSLLTIWDERDSKIHPHEGFYISHELQTAGGILFGDARDIRTQPEVRFYIPLYRKWTIALRGMVGFLFPSNYGASRDEESTTDEALQNRDTQLVFFRGFFSGGPSSNRGYPLRGVGPHGTIPFLLAPSSVTQSAQCDQNSTDPVCSLPLGGFSIWEASAELRFPIYGPLSGAAFCDTSDVSLRRLDIRLNRPHLSCGAGLRYDTPVGPIRLDIGCRIPKMQRLTSSSSPREDGDPGNIFGAPIAIAFGIGQAF